MKSFSSELTSKLKSRGDDDGRLDTGAASASDSKRFWKREGLGKLKVEDC